MRPLVGISSNRFAPDPSRPIFKGMELHYGEAHLVESLRAAGALPVIVPDLKSEADLRELVSRLDGLVLSGGADISPESYGRRDYDPKWPGDKVRDAFELALFREALAAGTPILGVCRGMQILNVAYGGTLFQDISSEKPGALIHRDWDVYEQNTHEVRLEKGSWLERLYGKTSLLVNTVHHQGVRDLAPGLKAVAFAPDGVIEAVEDARGRWIRGVQWHPEWRRLDRKGVDDLDAVFRDFVTETGAGRARRKS